MADPHGAASLEPVQAQAVLHKQHHLAKWSQGKTRACSCYELVMGKRARECQGMSGALVVQEQQARAKMDQRRPNKGLCSMLKRKRNKSRGLCQPTLVAKNVSSPKMQMWGMKSTFSEHEQQAPS